MCRLCINLKKPKFEQRMRKKMAFQYKFYTLAVGNITFSCFGSSLRVSTNDIAANYGPVCSDQTGFGLKPVHRTIHLLT